MKPATTSHSALRSPSLHHWLSQISAAQWLFLALLTALTACVMWRVELPMLRGADPAWSARIRPYAWLLHFHASCGLLALLAGPWQFLPVMRKHAPRLHRALGMLYMASIVAASFSSLWIAYHYMSSADGLAAMAQAVIWLFCTATALYMVRRGDIHQHRLWMARSYALTFTFLLSRFATEVMHWHLKPESGGNAAFIWMLSVGMLVVADALIATRR